MQAHEPLQRFDCVKRAKRTISVLSNSGKASWPIITRINILLAFCAYPHDASALNDLTPIVLPGTVSTDVTPFTVAPERNLFSPAYKFRLFQKLPARLWFTATAEASQRVESNVLFTSTHAKPDYALRVLPNLTVGYNLTANTSIYSNYFALKDSYLVHPALGTFATQSLAWGIRHTKQLGSRSTLQLDMQARELFQTSTLHQFDFLPGVTLTHRLSRRDIAFASALLQLRGGNYFVAPTREVDPFYSIGYIHRQGLWTFSAIDTLNTNYRNALFNDAIPHQGNVSMIADFEVNHPISKRIPSLLAFARAEPVYNWGSHNKPGLSGVDFRLFTGVRITVSKPSYYAAMERMRKQILEQKRSETLASANPSSNPSSNTQAELTSSINQTPSSSSKPHTQSTSSQITPAQTPVSSVPRSSTITSDLQHAFASPVQEKDDKGMDSLSTPDLTVKAAAPTVSFAKSAQLSLQENE